MSLARQVAELKKLLEQQVERSRPHLCLQIIFADGTSEEEIERLQAQAAADAGVDPAEVTLWIHRRLISPLPCVEPRSPLRHGQVAELPDSILGEPRKHFERKPDATAVEPTPPRSEPGPVVETRAWTEQPERPMPLTYPDEGSWK